MNMYVCMYVCMHACMHVCMYACMHVCMYACLHVCMYACMYACMYVYIVNNIPNPKARLHASSPPNGASRMPPLVRRMGSLPFFAGPLGLGV